MWPSRAFGYGNAADVFIHVGYLASQLNEDGVSEKLGSCSPKQEVNSTASSEAILQYPESERIVSICHSWG